MSDSVQHALRVTRELASRLGVPCTPTVLADRSHLVLRLAPHPLVARVAMSTSTTRVGLAWLAREVAIARHLHGIGVPVTRPATVIDPGPHAAEDLFVSFWVLEDRMDLLDPELAGRRLREVHRGLASFDASSLPEWGVVTEARAILDRACDGGLLTPDESTRLRRAWEGVEGTLASARARSASFQPVHGDAHLGNVFATSRGPLWTDWEDACIAPVEWDLATLRARNLTFGEESESLTPALVGYGVDHDPDLVHELVLLRNLQVIPWLVVFAERQPELLARARARLDQLDRLAHLAHLPWSSP